MLDPSAAVAHRHIHDPIEAARIAEIDALAATEPRPGEGTARMLSQLARFLDFSIYFASVVRGERASYRVQRGLPPELTAFRELRREMSYCTHCVSTGMPFIVEDAAREPFFRGNKAVTRFGVVAYAGVPLRLTTGTILGTLCALDFTPHAIPIGTVRLMEAFARRAVAEIERERAPHLFPELVLAASDRADVHTAAFFVDLVDAARAHSHDTARPLTLLTFRAPGASAVLPWLDENDTAGSLGEGAFGLLLPASDPAVLDERAARLHAGGAEGVALTTAPPEPASPKST
ncbi:MAG: GAF domain-containing protein [Polyangiaceae bacterium]